MNKEWFPLVVIVCAALNVLFGVWGLVDWLRDLRRARPNRNKCLCSHERNYHVGGNWKCGIKYRADAEWPEGAQCSCVFFIADQNAVTAPVDELERIAKL